MDQKGSAAMLTSIQSVGVAPEVNLRNSLHTGHKAHKRGIHPGFETQGRHHQKSKTGMSVVPRKGLMSSKKFFFKKKDMDMGQDLSMYDLSLPVKHKVDDVDLLVLFTF